MLDRLSLFVNNFIKSVIKFLEITESRAFSSIFYVRKNKLSTFYKFQRIYQKTHQKHLTKSLTESLTDSLTQSLTESFIEIALPRKTLYNPSLWIHSHKDNTSWNLSPHMPVHF